MKWFRTHQQFPFWMGKTVKWHPKVLFEWMSNATPAGFLFSYVVVDEMSNIFINKTRTETVQLLSVAVSFFLCTGGAVTANKWELQQYKINSSNWHNRIIKWNNSNAYALNTHWRIHLKKAQNDRNYSMSFIPNDMTSNENFLFDKSNKFI